MTKKITSLLMAVALVFSMGLVSFAASSVTTIESGVFVTSIDYVSGSAYNVGDAVHDIDGDYQPGDTVNIYLNPSKFTGADILFNAETGMSAKELEKAGVTFKFSSNGKNANLIKDVSFKEKEINKKQVALIQVKLVDNIASTEEKEFDTTITLYANKKKQQAINLFGTVGGSVTKIDSSEVFIKLGNGEIAEATENIAKIEVDAGEDISLFAKMYKGKKYSAVASSKATDADMKLLSETEGLDFVYYLNTAGFLANDVSVKINTNDKFYVYDVAGKLLGTTEEELALSSKYYLATKEVKLSFGSDNTDDGDYNEPGVELDEPTSGDSGTDTEIPETGIGMMPKIALTAFIIGLAAIVILLATGKKRKD